MRQAEGHCCRLIDHRVAAETHSFEVGFGRGKLCFCRNSASLSTGSCWQHVSEGVRAWGEASSCVAAMGRNLTRLSGRAVGTKRVEWKMKLRQSPRRARPGRERELWARRRSAGSSLGCCEGFCFQPWPATPCRPGHKNDHQPSIRCRTRIRIRPKAWRVGSSNANARGRAREDFGGSGLGRSCRRAAMPYVRQPTVSPTTLTLSVGVHTKTITNTVITTRASHGCNIGRRLRAKTGAVATMTHHDHERRRRREHTTCVCQR